MHGLKDLSETAFEGKNRIFVGTADEPIFSFDVLGRVGGQKPTGQKPTGRTH